MHSREIRHGSPDYNPDKLSRKRLGTGEESKHNLQDAEGRRKQWNGSRMTKKKRSEWLLVE